MRHATPNVRFWNYWNGSYSRLTLKPGDTLTLDRCESTDEGHEYETEEYEYDAHEGIIICTMASGGIDCDGPIMHHAEFVWHPGGDITPALDMDENGELHIVRWNGQPCMRPCWTKQSAWQRDAYAEAAGY
jgi:hypothetical protein